MRAGRTLLLSAFHSTFIIIHSSNHSRNSRWTEQTSATIKDYVMGQYVVNDAAGIRTHPYSTSKTTNPLTYSSVGTLNEVHSTSFMSYK